MTDDAPAQTLLLLRRMTSGDSAAEQELFERVYADLHRQARAVMRSQPRDALLQTTALVGEAWLRLEGYETDWQDRAHFLRVAARAMRWALVDHVRARHARGPVEGAGAAEDTPGKPSAAESLLALHEALELLEPLERDQAQVAELRIFGGLNHAEIGEVLGVSARTIDRLWRAARARLQHALGHEGLGEPG